MAEKEVLFQLDINVDALLKDSADSRKSIKSLKEEIKALEKAEDDQGEAVEQLTLQLQLEQKQLRENQKLTKNVILTNKENKGSINALRAELATTTVQWAKLSREERTNTDSGKALVAQKKKLTEELKKEEKATSDTRRNVGNYTEGIQGAFGATSQLIPGLGKASSAMQLFGTAMKVALGPLGLLIAAGFALKEFFTSSEEGQNKLNKIMAIFGVILGNLSDLLSDVGEALFDTFTNPREALDSFVEAIKENLINRFEGLLELIPKLGEAISLLFKGEFAEAGKVAGDAVAKVTLGIEDFSDKAVDAFGKAKDAITDIIDETEREIAVAIRLANLQANLDKTVRANTVENAKLQRDVSKLRADAAKKDEFDSKQRLAFLDEVIKKEKEILENNLETAKTRAFIRAEQNKLSKSTKEDLNDLAQLEANVFNVQKANFEKEKSLQRERQTTLKENAAEETKILKEKAKQEVEILKQRLEEEKTHLDAEKQRRIINEENELALQETNVLARLESKRAELEEQRLIEIEFAQKVGADTTLIDQKFANAREAIAEAETDAKLSLASGFVGNIAAIFGKQTAIGKAAAVAETAVNTYRGATAAYAALAGVPVVGPALGIAAAAAAVVAGLANVKKILSIKSGLPGDSGGGQSIPTGGGVPASTQGADLTAPTINQGIVSRDALLQIQPPQTSAKILVVDEVTAAQNGQTSNKETSLV
jgi:hypothetical protein